MQVMRALLVCLLLVVAGSAGAIPNAVIVNDFGDAGPGNCNTTCTLRDAIAVALASAPVKVVSFSAEAGWPQTIVLIQGQLAITNASADVLVISGPGTIKLSISAGNFSRVFDVVSGSLYVSALTVRDGKVTGTPGAPGDSGTGEPGGSPGITQGGCVRIAQGAVVEFEQIDVRQCVLIGGRGGNGGEGEMVFGPGGPGGVGGSGGQAAGGGIYTAGDLTLRHSSVTLGSSTGGVGGDGGAGGGGFVQGDGGKGGNGGIGTGGAVYVAEHGRLLLQNSTLAASTAAGAAAGKGGAGGSVGGHGGDGGFAYGPLLHTQGAVSGEPGTASVEFSTLANPVAVAGSAGPGGAPGGGGGTAGGVHGAAVWGGGSATFLSSVIVGTPGFPLCELNVAAAPGSANIDQDSSCSGFTLHKTFTEVLRNVDPALTPWPAYMPVYKGSAIDAAAACTGTGGSEVFADDQHDTPRPQGSACDLGAIETDYVFVDGFGGP